MAGFSPADIIPVATAWAAIGRCPGAISDHLGEELYNIFSRGWTDTWHITAAGIEAYWSCQSGVSNGFLSEFVEIVRRAFICGVKDYQKRSETRVPHNISHEPIHCFPWDAFDSLDAKNRRGKRLSQAARFPQRLRHRHVIVGLDGWPHALSFW